MKFIRSTLALLVSLSIGLCVLAWDALMFILSALDYEPDRDEKSDTNVWYNHRTGEIDPVKRHDGIYQEPLQK
ncbi:hypothetical protein R50073_48840 (plasmid) [Maricurvus nonylphenolicus]|uniref:hypothetical protein n=1 Tax=Maricurvus nonylphenolicus TaxID=1008307 RepID=UPI0036F20788